MLRFAGDMTLLVLSKKKLEKALSEIEDILAEHCNMKISKKITKILVCNRKEGKHRTRINITEENVEEVQ